MIEPVASIPLRQQIPLLMTGVHYLDNAATALMPTTVLEAIHQYDMSNRANIGRGLYHFAEVADVAYAAARQRIAHALSTQSDNIVFTAGSTAALNLLALALSETLAPGAVVLMSIAEHHSQIVPWQLAAKRHGLRLRFFSVDDNGAPDVAAAGRAIDQYKPAVVAVTHRSNVSGSQTDISAIASIAKASGAMLIVDGAQYVPHELPDLPMTGADFYVFSGHKCYAPNGVGILWGRTEALAGLPRVIGGGGAVLQVNPDSYVAADSPHCWEVGTPPITPAIGLAEAIHWMLHWPLEAVSAAAILAKKLRSGLAAIPAVRLLFTATSPTPIVSFVVDGVHSHDVCEYLAMYQVAVRGGHLCAQPLMQHLGINGCVRVSLAAYNDDSDIEQLLTATEAAIDRLR